MGSLQQAWAPRASRLQFVLFKSPSASPNSTGGRRPLAGQPRASSGVELARLVLPVGSLADLKARVGACLSGRVGRSQTSAREAKSSRAKVKRRKYCHYCATRAAAPPAPTAARSSPSRLMATSRAGPQGALHLALDGLAQRRRALLSALAGPRPTSGGSPTNWPATPTRRLDKPS